MRRIISVLGGPSWMRGMCAVFGLWVTIPITLNSQAFTTLYSFPRGGTPFGALIQATDGNLHGTTSDAGKEGQGTVFRITPNGTLTTIYSFCSLIGCPDGEEPFGALVQAINGDFYGTTTAGGINLNGSVFKLDASGALTTLHSFCSQGLPCPDGSKPEAGLVQAPDGYFFGETSFGGESCGIVYDGCGTIFRLTPGGTLTTLYSFCPQNGCVDGATPKGGLVLVNNQEFYGTTIEGGTNNSGTVFKITPSGTLTTLYSFCSQKIGVNGCADGGVPSGLVQGNDGDLYGTTQQGGTYCVSDGGCGTVFKISRSGALSTLHSFCSQTNCADGQLPYAGLVRGTDGNFYGTTEEGGVENGGTIFEMTPSGALTTLYSFCSQTNCADGFNPFAALVQATNGEFYGTTGSGAYDYGTVFSLSIGLGPFVETQIPAGKVGAIVKILGTDLTGATSVSFNGTEAVFKIISSSYIVTTVPPGATSGTLRVVTPNVTLSSNVSFLVLP